MSHSSKYYSKFIKFIETRRKQNVDNFVMTHTSLGTPKGSFDFSGKYYQKFLKLYIDVLNNDENCDLHFTERPNDNGITFLFIDVDYDQEDNNRQYTESILKNIVSEINNIFIKNYDVNKNQLKAFITEKPTPTKKNNEYKDGFHIYYPEIGLRICDRYFIIDKLNSIMIQKDLFGNINYTSEKDTIFDRSVIKNNGNMMIGSKKTGCDPYYLTKVYDYNLKEDNVEDYDTCELVNLLSNQKFDELDYIKSLNDKIESEIINISEEYNGGNKKKTKKHIENVREKDSLKSKKYDSDSDSDSDDDEDGDDEEYINKLKDIKVADKLVDILSKKRASNYNSWFKIGIILYAISDKLFKSFVKFSKKDKVKFNDGKVTCEYVWNKAKEYKKYYDKPLGTLKYLARSDNNKKYFKFMRDLYDPIFGKAESGTHVDLASVIYELYNDRFVCVSKKSNMWFEFQKHRWVPIQSAYTLENVISGDFRSIFVLYCSDKMNEAHKDGNNFKDDDIKKYSKLMNVANKLGDIGFLEKVVKACSNKFMDTEFEAKLNLNINLVGFNNGVYDLREGLFRGGMPSDMISVSVGYDYKEYNDDDSEILFLKDYFRKILCEDDMYNYILTFIASILRGEPDQKLHLWTGVGSNGKSTTTELLKYMLGEYYGVLDITYFTKESGNSSSASPELARLPYCRLVVTDEPNPNDNMLVGKMKKITGGDTIPARALYGSNFEYKPQFTIIMPCNDMPNIKSNIEAVWRRLRNTPFQSRFVNNKNEIKNKRDFLKDNELREKIRDYGSALMWFVLKHYYPIYKNGYENKKYNIYEPKKVIEHTNEYRKESDSYLEFIEEQIEVTGDNDDTEDLQFIYQTFTEWYSSSYSEKPPPKKKFIKYLKENNYKYDKLKIYGIKYALGMRL